VIVEVSRLAQASAVCQDCIRAGWWVALFSDLIHLSLDLRFWSKCAGASLVLWVVSW